MAKRRSFGVNIGSSSLLLIFVILCLVSFAALSIVSANADNKLGKKIMDRTSLYYEASNKAQETIASIDETLKTTYESCKGNEDAYFAAVGNSISFEIEISDLQKLEIELEVCFPKASGDSFYKITSYKVVTRDDISYDDTLPVMQFN